MPATANYSVYKHLFAHERRERSVDTVDDETKGKGMSETEANPMEGRSA